MVYLQTKNPMKLSDFQFELPNKLLAQRPSQDRDESRLMVLNRKEEKIEHHTFKDIINFFARRVIFQYLSTSRGRQKGCLYLDRQYIILFQKIGCSNLSDRLD